MRKVVVLTAMLATTVTACGGTGSGSSSAATSLTISTRTGSESVLVPSDATLECGNTPKATGFLHAVAGPACEAVEGGAVTEVAKSQKSGRLCSQIYGGPQTAHITGTIDDKRVNVRVDRTDGCGVEDWTALEAVLGPPERTGDVNRASTTTTTAGPTTSTAQVTTHVVQRGDTLTSIAQQFGVRVADLRAANPQLADPDNLVEGEVITVPLSSRPVLTVTTPTDQPFQLQFSLSGAQPGEQVVFIVATPQGSFTGPPHVADDQGAVSAVYDAGGLAGDYAVLAKGSLGSVARSDFHINAPGT